MKKPKNNPAISHDDTGEQNISTQEEIFDIVNYEPEYGGSRFNEISYLNTEFIHHGEEIFSEMKDGSVIIGGTGMKELPSGQYRLSYGNISGKNEENVTSIIKGSEGGVELNMTGDLRYFAFIPEKNNPEGEYVAARVLDIWHNHRTKTCIVYVDYIGKPVKGHRTRFMTALSHQELKSVVRNSLFSGERIKEMFLNELSPVEIETTKLAKSRGINRFNFVSRKGKEWDLWGGSALHYLTGGSNAMYHLTLIQNFGPMKAEMLFDSDKDITLYGYGKVSVCDQLARLHPGFVLDTYGANNIEYSFVITEDGQLKIGPKGKIGQGIHPALVRLAGGRRIFDGGDFTLSADGDIIIKSFSANRPKRYADEYAFDEFSNHKSYDFIDSVFRMHTGRKVVNDNFIGDGQERNRTYTKGKSRSDRFDRMHEDFGGNQESEHTTHSTGLEWDENIGNVLSLQDWIDKNRYGDSSSKQLDWAYYVLKVNKHMKLKDIKKAYRSLAKKFHPDKNEDGEHVMKILGNAYEIVQKLYNSFEH